MSRRDDVMLSFEREKDKTEQRIKDGVEKYRKGLLSVRFTDKSGKPIANAEIRARLTDHEFLHGANLFMLGQFDSEEYNEKYEKAFVNCFNEATLPIYWKDLEPRDGELRFSKDSMDIYRRPPLEPCVEFCEKNGILPKAHCLTYFNFDPEWIDEYDIPKLKARIERRYKELAEAYGDRIPQWEVINELLCVTDMDRSKTPYYFDDRVMENCFDTAEKYFKNCKLIINEAVHLWDKFNFAHNRSAYYQMVERALKGGTKIDSVGLQFHVFKRAEDEKSCVETLYKPSHIYSVLDRYALLGKPLQITEITVPAYTDSKEDYALQAEILSKLYHIWFSHPAVEAAIYWNLPDGYAAFAPKGDMNAGENYYRGGLMDFALDKKPAYDALYDMFHSEYTTDVKVVTDENGVAKFNGFFGKYSLTADGKEYSVKLYNGKENADVQA